MLEKITGIGDYCMKKSAEIEIIKQSETKYQVKVEGVIVAVFMKWENALTYEKDLQELNPYIGIRNKWAK